jgi:hypothetical protein
VIRAAQLREQFRLELTMRILTIAILFYFECLCIFRVIVVLPFLISGNLFDDNITQDKLRKIYGTICRFGLHTRHSNVHNTITHSVRRGGISLLEKLSEACPEVCATDYVCFYALRQLDSFRHRVVTEQLYVKNKVSCM